MQPLARRSGVYGLRLSGLIRPAGHAVELVHRIDSLHMTPAAHCTWSVQPATQRRICQEHSIHLDSQSAFQTAADLTPALMPPPCRKGMEMPQLVTLVEPLFNQLTVFDPRFPHGVRPVHGTRDPMKSRLVLHGEGGAQAGAVVAAGSNDA